MDLEIRFFLENFTERDPKQLMEHIQRMASGETPFLPTTLSLVYDKLIQKAFVRSPATSAGPGKSAGTGGQSITEPAPPTQSSNTTSSVGPPPTPVPTPSTQQAEPELVPPGAVWLECFQCGERARTRDLYDGMRCPRCPSRSPEKGGPSCNVHRVTSYGQCVGRLVLETRARLDLYSVSICCVYLYHFLMFSLPAGSNLVLGNVDCEDWLKIGEIFLWLGSTRVQMRERRLDISGLSAPRECSHAP